MSQSVTNRAIEEAHLNTLTARQAVAVVDDPSEPLPDRKRSGMSAREALQNEVAAYFEVLRPYLVETPEGRRYFEGEAPKSVGDLGRGVLSVELQRFDFNLDQYAEPPEDADPVERREHLVKQTEDFVEQWRGEYLVIGVDVDGDRAAVVVQSRKFETGLKRLDTMFQERERVQKQNQKGVFGDGGSFLTGHKSDEEDRFEKKMKLQPLGVLMRAARELDRAAVDLNLLADVEESDALPYMRDFDASKNGHATAEVSAVKTSGSPDI